MWTVPAVLGNLLIGNHAILPAPWQVAQGLWQLLLSGEIFDAAGTSLRRLAVSFSLAGLIGIPLGLVMGVSRLAHDLADPVVEILRPISGIAWIPLGMFILGVGDELPVAIMFYGRAVPVRSQHARGRAEHGPPARPGGPDSGLARWTILRQVVVPAAIPNILVGARLAAGAAWMSMVAAELIGAPSGLGFAIEWYRELLMTPKMLAFVVLVGILGFLVDRVLRAAQRHLTPWAPASGAD